MENKIIVFTEKSEYFEECENLSKKLSLPFTKNKAEAEKYNLQLKKDENGLSLIGNGQAIRGDFSKMMPRLKPNNLNGEMLIKASKFKDKPLFPIAVDMTAGLGEDSFLLAAYGYKVIMFEKDEIIACLLEDAIKRGEEIPEISNIFKRMTLIVGDSVAEIVNIADKVDVVYLDPMFSERQKSGLVKKKFQVIHNIEKPCSDETALLDSALSISPRRIVIKRPKKAEILGNIKPSYSIDGKSIRYDVIVK